MRDEKQFQLLLLKSRGMFMKYGLKNLSMDQIAKELGMSKKTIYRFVENKAELIKLTLRDYLQEERLEMDGFLKKSNNSVDEMVQMIAYFLQVVREFNASALYDMQKYYPEAWDLYNDHRYNYMLGRINDNLKTGVKEGFYRKDMDTDIISRIYVMGVEILLNQDLFPSNKYTFHEIYREFLNYHLRAIVSAKGLKYLEENKLSLRSS